MVSERVSCGLGVWRPAPLLLLLLLVQLAATQTGGRCPQPCVPLPQCPHLLHLLSTSESSDINAVREATCTFTSKEPMVCCPSVPSQDVTTLLPRDCGQARLISRILGGINAPMGGYPWTALLGYSGGESTAPQFLCSGAVVNERYVLTSAHCVNASSLRGKRLEVIRLGEWDLSTEQDCEETLQEFQHCADPVQDFTYEEIISHPDYNTRTKYSDDIALIRLNRPAHLSGSWVKPICLPPQDLDVQRVVGHRETVVAGWGLTEKGRAHEKLLHVSLRLVGNEQCSSAYGVKLVDGQICIGGRAGQDSCAGDSGGPLIVSGPTGPPYLLIGVVSYGPTNCGTEGHPGVYTSVSHYKNWIEQNLRA